MNARRRRALASAVGALVVSVLCAALSTNVDGVQRTVLIVLTFAWLVIAASCVVNALRTASPEPAVLAEPTVDPEGAVDPQPAVDPEPAPAAEEVASADEPR